MNARVPTNIGQRVRLTCQSGVLVLFSPLNLVDCFSSSVGRKVIDHHLDMDEVNISRYSICTHEFIAWINETETKRHGTFGYLSRIYK